MMHRTLVSLLVLGALSLDAAVASAATFRLERGENGFDFIYIEGQIAAGDDDHFRRLAVGSNEGVVVLESPGGALVTALEIGKTIQLKGFATYVPDDVECVSACALVWIAGSPRYLSASSRIGFHASYRDVNGRLEETGVGNAIVGRYLTLLNLPEKAVIFATSASPTSVTWLNPQDSSRSGIAFELLDLEQSAPSTAASASPAETVASAGDFTWEEGTWSVWTNREGRSCGILQAFSSEGGIENFSSVGAMVPWETNDARFVFNNEKFRSLVTGRTYDLEIVFEKGDTIDTGWGVREFTADGNLLSVTLHWSDLEPDLRTGSKIAFFNGEDIVDVFDLDGSARALDQLAICRQQGRGAGLVDPFAR